MTLKVNTKLVRPSSNQDKSNLNDQHSDDEEEEHKKTQLRKNFAQGTSLFKKKSTRTIRKHGRMLSTILKNDPDHEEANLLNTTEIKESDLKPESIENYKRLLFNEARQFFLSYLGCVEVLEQGELVRVQFQIPYFCKYITENIKESIVWNTVRSSDQERLEMFLSKIIKYEYQMKRRQSISSRKWLYLLIDNWKMAKRLNFLVVMAINIILVIGVAHEFQIVYNTSPSQVDGRIRKHFEITNTHVGFDNRLDNKYHTGFILIEIIQLVLCILNFCLVVYETSPVILFNYLLAEQAKSYKSSQKLNVFDRTTNEEGNNVDLSSMSRVKKVAIICTDLTNIYNLILLILSVIALSGYKLFYALLLFDLATISSTMKRIVVGLVNNYKIILRSGGLLIVLVYFMSIIGFDYFPRVFNRVNLGHPGSHTRRLQESV